MDKPTLAEQATTVIADDERRRLIFDANYQIQKMAEGVLRLLQENAGDDFMIYHGMLARISALSNLIFDAAELNGPQHAHNFDVDTSVFALRRRFEGCH